MLNRFKEPLSKGQETYYLKAFKGLSVPTLADHQLSKNINGHTQQTDFTKSV